MSLVIAFLVTFILVPVVIRSKIIDKPNYRSIHVKETPKAGGIAIFFGVLAGILMNGYGMAHWAFSALLIGAAGLGFLDDVKNLSPKTKLLAQLVLSICTIVAGYQFNIFGNLIDSILTVVWIIGFMNAFNLIDGMDGLAAGVAVISAGAFLLLGNSGFSAILLPLIGALAAFLIYNFKPAKIFMGDTGSMLLGYFLGVMGLMTQSSANSNILGMISLILILFYPIFDTFLSIIRRKVNNHPILAPDRSHSYNLMVDQLGLGVLQTICLIYLLSIFTGIIGILTYRSFSLMVGMVTFLTIVGVLVFMVLRLRLLSESKYEKSKE